MDCSPLGSPNHSNHSHLADEPFIFDDEDTHTQDFYEKYDDDIRLDHHEPKESPCSTTIRSKKDNDSSYQERLPIYENEEANNEYDALYEECGYDYEADGMAEENKGSPVVLNIRGIDIMFPYEPYEPQRVYMEKVIEALDGKKNALLQSPTGTGKTLCLLCATLAWAQKKKTKIYYCTRTHTQIKQVLDQLKATSYRPAVSILSSRSQSCLQDFASNKDLKHSKVNKKCKQLRECRLCEYYLPIDNDYSKKMLLEKHRMDLCDIEDLCKKGEEEKYCPHYLEKEKMKTADLVLLAYNYVLDKMIRRATKIKVSNSIIIFDEAHNIGQKIEETMTHSLSVQRLLKCERGFDKILRDIAEDPDDESEEMKTKKQITHLIDPMKNLCGYLSNKKAELESRYLEHLKGHFHYKANLRQARNRFPVEYSEHSERLDYTHFYDQAEGYDIFDIFKYMTAAGATVESFFPESNSVFKEGIDTNNFQDFIKLLYQAKGVEVDNKMNLQPDKKKKRVRKLIRGLGSLIQFSKEVLDLLTEYRTYSRDDLINNHILSYKLQFCLKKNSRQRPSNNPVDNINLEEDDLNPNYLRVPENYFDMEVTLVCLNPGVGFSYLARQNPLSFILTSGTLAPFESFRAEFFTEFPIDLINSHVIDTTKQCKTFIIKRGERNRQLNFSLKKSNENPDSILDVGHAIIKLAQTIPNGMLLCFPSRRLMTLCLKTWQSNGNNILAKLQQVKEIFEEPEKARDLTSVIERYKKKAESDGAILFCICKGKVSEGLNFEDERARAVILIGIHNLPVKDFKVEEKRKFLDAHRSYFKGFNGKKWYEQEASRTFNQAIGRVIRHKNDWGLVYLFDERFEQKKTMLPNWIQDNAKAYTDFDSVVKETLEFLKNINENQNQRPRHINAQNTNILAPQNRTLAETLLNKPNPFQYLTMNQYFEDFQGQNEWKDDFLDDPNFKTPNKGVMTAPKEKKTPWKSGPIKEKWSQRDDEIEELRVVPSYQKLKKNLKIQYEQNSEQGEDDFQGFNYNKSQMEVEFSRAGAVSDVSNDNQSQGRNHMIKKFFHGNSLFGEKK